MVACLAASLLVLWPAKDARAARVMLVCAICISPGCMAAMNDKTIAHPSRLAARKSATLELARVRLI